MTCTSNKATTATADSHSEDNSSSGDDVPLSMLVKNKSQENTASKMDQNGGSSTDDDIPLTKFVTRKQNESVDDLNKDQIEDSSSSADDMPLTKLTTIKKKSNKKTVSNKDHNGNDGSSSDDDVPLTKLVTKKQTDKRSQGKKEKDKQLKSSNIDPKSKTQDSSSEDGGPLSKLATENTKNGLSSKRKNASYKDRSVLLSSDSDSDDEPLSELVKKLQDQKTADESRVSKRNAAKKKVKYVESSSDNSHDEPLAKLKTSKSPAKPKSTSTRRAPAKSKQLLSSESSDDEPLINFVKKAHNQTSGKTKKSNTGFKKAKKATKKDDNLIKVANSLKVKKVLRIILERCDIEETKVAEVPTKQVR